MNIVQKYIDIISKLLSEEVVFTYYISFGNFYPSEYRVFKDEDIIKIKNINGLHLHLNTVKKYNDFKSSHDINSWIRLISEFTLIQMPGCCGMCISTNVKVSERYRNKGLNNILNQMRIDIAKESGYGILICTDIISNTPERATLSRNHWKDIYNFNNPRTKNQIAISIKEL